jgi:DNA end-binding protein Ku
MAPRASWKGYLKLSLVSCPIALYPASSSSERVSFNRINKKTGTRLKQQLVDAETGETVEKEDNACGYEIGKGQYLQIEDEEIEKIRIAPTPFRSILSFLELRSTTATSIARITSRLLTRLDRRLLPSSAMRSATRKWSP